MSPIDNIPRPTKWCVCVCVCRGGGGGGGGVYWIHLVHLSVCLSVRSITPVCFGISISNFICILFVAMGRSVLIFSDVTLKMAAWPPSWIFWFPDSNFNLALNIKSKLQWHITCVYGKEPIDFQQYHFQNGHLVAILEFFGFRTLTSVCLWISNPNFSSTLPACMGR